MDQGGLLGQLGIDWKLLLSQAVNFFILLIVLHQFVYKPLLKVIKKRQETIQDGLDKAREADTRLKEVDHIAAQHIHKAERESMAMMKQGQERAKKTEEALVKKAEEKQTQLMQQAEVQYQKQQEENRKKVLQEAAVLVKQLIIKTVELKPDTIDEALIKKAAEGIKHELQS